MIKNDDEEPEGFLSDRELFGPAAWKSERRNKVSNQ